MVGLTGLEPVTLRLSSACSNQLSYRPETARERREVNDGGRLPIGQEADRFPAKMRGEMEAWGFEPQTYSLQSYRSTN